MQQTRHTGTDSHDDMLNEHEPLFNVLEKNTTRPLLVTVELNGAKAKMEVDAGASASIISKETYKTLWPEVVSRARRSSPTERPSGNYCRWTAGM